MKCAVCDTDIGNGRGPLAPYCSVHCRDIARLKDDLDTVVDERDEYMAEAAELRDRNEKLVDHYECKMSGHERATRLEAEVAKLREENADALASLDAGAMQMGRLREEMERLATGNLEAQLHAAKENAKLRGENERLKAQAQYHYDKQRKAEAERDRLLEEVKRWKARLKNAHEATGLSDKHDRVGVAVAALRAERDRLKEENERLEEDIREADDNAKAGWFWSKEYERAWKKAEDERDRLKDRDERLTASLRNMIRVAEGELDEHHPLRNDIIRVAKALAEQGGEVNGE